MAVTGNEFARASYDATIGGWLNIRDPGTAGTFTIGEVNNGLCELTIAAAAETRTLPTAASFRSGVEFTVVANQITTAGTHYCTVNSIGLAAEGDFAVFKTMLVNDAMTWVCIHRGNNSFVARAPVTLSTTATLLAPIHANRPLMMAGAGSARVYTLPAATGTGNSYLFFVKTVNTSGYTITSGVSSDYMEGSIYGWEAAGDSYPWPSLIGTGNIICLLNGTTTGGVVPGDWVEFTDTASAVWTVRGNINQSGAQATPFST